MESEKKFKVYRSSAGSGKTYTLTKEYIKLALSAPGIDKMRAEEFNPYYFRHILAVTFTNDAANEMKSRIVSRLSEMAETEDDRDFPFADQLLEEIAEEYPETAFDRKELRRRAGEVYKVLLHTYSDFSVGTIDSFTNRIVRSFTRDLDLPYNYEIEIDTKEILEKSVDSLLSKTGSRGDRELSDLLLEFARKQAEDTKDWNLEKALRKFGANLFREDRYAMISPLSDLSAVDFQQIRHKLVNYRSRVYEQVTSAAGRAIELAKSVDLKTEDFAYGKSGVWNYYLKHADEDKLYFQAEESSRVLAAIENGDWQAKKMKGSQQEADLRLIVDDLVSIFYEIEDIKKAEIGHVIAVNNILKNIYLLALANELDREIRQLMSEENKVHITDFNRKINEIVIREPVPYIYERLGERYKHILIDEFQDTSEMQWHNLIPLITHNLGLNNTNMAVGDGKQAVYRWRGGNADLLVQLPEVPSAEKEGVLAKEIGIFRHHHRGEVLRHNRRSKANIVNFNNLFFSQLINKYETEFPAFFRYYAEAEQLIAGSEGGHTEIELLPSELTEDEYKNYTWEKVYYLTSVLKARGYRLRDIAVLCRRNESASFLAEKFIEKGIRVISSESLKVVSSRKVRFVVDFLKIFAQPLNPPVKAEILYFIYDHLTYELGREDLGKTGERHLAVAEVSREKSISSFLKFITQNFGLRLQYETLQYLSIYETAEELIRVFRLNEQNAEQIYLQKMLDIMSEFGLRHGSNLIDFAEYWDLHSEGFNINSPESGEAVRILTVHKSKGLEFPAVILPFADWSVKPKPGTEMWVPWEDNPVVPELKTAILTHSKDLEHTQFAELYRRENEMSFIDAANMLYVAMTRAESSLFVIGKKMRETKGEQKTDNVGHLLHRFAEENRENCAEFSEEDNRITAVFSRDISAYVGKEKPELFPYTIRQFLSTECRSKIRMRRDDLSDDEKTLSISDLYSARRHGLAVHAVLSKIRYAEDVEKALEQTFFEGLINAGEKETIREKVEEVLQNAACRELFLPHPARKIHNEKTVFYHAAGKTIMLRPDRLVLEGKSAIVADYKTGAQQDRHLKQIRRYGTALQSAGYEKVRLLLIYTEEQKVVEVG